MASARSDGGAPKRRRTFERLGWLIAGLLISPFVGAVVSDLVAPKFAVRVVNANESKVLSVSVAGVPIAPVLDPGAEVVSEILITAPTELSLKFRDERGTQYNCDLSAYIDPGERGRTSLGLRNNTVRVGTVVWRTPLSLLVGDTWPGFAGSAVCVSSELEQHRRSP